MTVILEILGNAWVQLIAWVIGAVLVFQFQRLMKGTSDCWNWIAIGVALIGIRIGYKLLPFYDSTQEIRYLLGIIGVTILFIGFIKLYYDVFKQQIEMTA